MASKSETIDIRCPSCKEEVKSTWKCCPHCETRLERLSCKPSTTSNLTERPHSLTDIIKVDPLHSDSIGPACIETPLTERQPLVNADNDIVSDCVDDPIQDAAEVQQLLRPTIIVFIRKPSFQSTACYHLQPDVSSLHLDATSPLAKMSKMDTIRIGFPKSVTHSTSL
ncbi:uncharacterized protein LOC127849542 isoform X4 [Dreissena polymorpha]|uniref:uncharacterized protein LOC127849542 isoform X4 n=1 Tax=Dreissena polymorpha TaxID=45954 RepID=UPI0022654D37|nr:uncharacterized protein LOC127849542 isoform X4 [Dreissena polymorpha]